MIRVGIVGATGYTGEELVKILSRHPYVRIERLSALIDKPTRISKIFPALTGRCDVTCKKLDVEDVSSSCDLVFLALPHRVSMQFVPRFLKSGKRLIDLSADYRLPAGVYKRWYGRAHTDRRNLRKAVYGIPELYKEDIKNANLVANPGCYPTSIILASAPLLLKKRELVDINNIIIDSKSGLTGAGRKASLSIIFSEVNENLKAYKVNEHQHKPEINQELAKLAGRPIDVVFTPHLIPINRGILSTIYFRLKVKLTQKSLIDTYKEFYKDKSFIRILQDGILPQIRDVVNTNFCDIGFAIRGDRLVVVSCIDNLTKGAAGQAVQNMNLMCGFKEEEGFTL